MEVLRDENGKNLKPFEPGADKIWTVANEQAKFGQFDAANLEQFLKVADNLRTEVARVTGLPMHYMNVSSGQQPSGEALRTSEARLVQKVKDRQGDFGDVTKGFSVLNEVRMAQAQALADVGMSEDEYSFLVEQVYKTAWAAEVAKATGGSLRS